MDVNSFLMGGAKSATFPTVGTTVQGVICEPAPQLMQMTNPKDGKPEFWDDAKTQPKMQLVITLKTNDRDPDDPQDDGERRLFVKSNMRKALAAAVRAAGARGIAVGGALAMTYVKDGPKPSPTLSAPKEYKARYIPPKQEVPVEDETPEPAAPQKDPGAQSPDDLNQAERDALEALMSEGK